MTGWVVGESGTIMFNDGVVSINQDQDSFKILQAFLPEQNYPNPFNPTTKIKYTIPSVETCDRVSVQLKVYDVLGKEIASLVNEEKPAGNYEVEFSRNLINQVLTSFCSNKKMLLLK